MYVMETKIPKNLEKLRDELSNIVFTYLCNNNVKVNQNKRLLIKGSVSCFIFNTFYKVKRSVNICGITLNKNHYSRDSIVNGVKTGRKVSYQYTRVLFDCLESGGYIKLNKGGVSDYGIVSGKWVATEFSSGYIEINKKLIRLYNQYEHNKVEDGVRKNVIILRDGKGVDVPFKTTPSVKLIKENLNSYNHLTFNFNVEKGKKVYDVQVYKVYNESFEKGARSYMSSEGIQGMSSEERHLLTINGKNTVIYDYKAFEPSIAYSMCGEAMEGDPYTIELEGFNPALLRSLCKKFLLVMMNIDNEKYLKHSLNSMIKEEFNIEALYKEGKIPDKRIDVKTIVEKLEDKHYLIRHMFYGKYHTQPSYIGSLVADYITDYFTQRGVLVLSVFDEFIIQEEYDEELKEVMFRAYEMILGSNTNCKVVKEK